MTGAAATLDDEKAALERLEKDRAVHRAASRAFFDLLDELWPPRGDGDYWENVADRVTETYRTKGKTPLLKHLLVAMMLYLEETTREETTEA